MTHEETLEAQAEIVSLEQRIRWYEVHREKQRLGPDWEPCMVKCYRARLDVLKRMLSEAGNATA